MLHKNTREEKKNSISSFSLPLFITPATVFFLVSFITQEKSKRNYASEIYGKEFIKTYTFIYDNEKHIVCRTFFLNIIGIYERLIKETFKK